MAHQLALAVHPGRRHPEAVRVVQEAEITDALGMELAERPAPACVLAHTTAAPHAGLLEAVLEGGVPVAVWRRGGGAPEPRSSTCSHRPGPTDDRTPAHWTYWPCPRACGKCAGRQPEPPEPPPAANAPHNSPQGKTSWCSCGTIPTTYRASGPWPDPDH